MSGSPRATFRFSNVWPVDNRPRIAADCAEYISHLSRQQSAVIGSRKPKRKRSYYFSQAIKFKTFSIMSKSSASPPAAAQRGVQYEQFACNYFQGISVQLNIRYNVGSTFPPSTLQTVTSLWYQIMAQLGAHSQVALARIPGNNQAARPVIIRQPVVQQAAGQKVALKFTPPTILPRNCQTLTELVSTNLYPTTSNDAQPATGPVQLFLYQEDDSDNLSKISACVINLNAALWDAVTIKLVLETFLFQLQKRQGVVSTTPTTPMETPVYHQLGGWIKVLYDSLPETPPEPMFLPIGEFSSADDASDNYETPNLSITDILGTSSSGTTTPFSGKDRRLVVTIDAETVGKCEFTCASKGLTLLDWHMACFTRCLAETYFVNHQHCKAATIPQVLQIDPRKDLLPIGSPTNFLNAIGIVTYGRTYKREEFEKNHPSQSTTVWLLEEAARTQQDIQKRLDRGEGSYKTIQAMTGQRYDDTPQKLSVVEFVHHGVYNTMSEAYQVECGHRFDPCEQMSVVSHQETGTGSWKLQIQIGKEQDREATIVLLEQILALWSDLASQ